MKSFKSIIFAAFAATHVIANENPEEEQAIVAPVGPYETSTKFGYLVPLTEDGFYMSGVATIFIEKTDSIP